MFLKLKILSVLVVFFIIFSFLFNSCYLDCAIPYSIVILGGIILGLIINYIIILFINLFQKSLFFNYKIKKDFNIKKLRLKYFKLKLYQLLILFIIFCSYMLSNSYLLNTRYGTIFKYLDNFINNSLLIGGIRIFLIIYILFLLLDINIYIIFKKNIKFINKIIKK